MKRTRCPIEMSCGTLAKQTEGGCRGPIAKMARTERHSRRFDVFPLLRRFPLRSPLEGFAFGVVLRSARRPMERHNGTTDEEERPHRLRSDGRIPENNFGQKCKGGVAHDPASTTKCRRSAIAGKRFEVLAQDNDGCSHLLWTRKREMEREAYDRRKKKEPIASFFWRPSFLPSVYFS